MTCGYHEILLHDMGEEELPFMSLSELDYLRRTWPRAIFAFMTRYQQAHCFLPLGTNAVVALPSHVVYSVERDCSGLH